MIVGKVMAVVYAVVLVACFIAWAVAEGVWRLIRWGISPAMSNDPNTQPDPNAPDPDETDADRLERERREREQQTQTQPKR